ncbi:MAG: hypothetical protein QUS14_14050 [Pyrinomonadaceae bacterium]|nr:hypothetical protein [Pyrinomonadaceae bacterium]
MISQKSVITAIALLFAAVTASFANPSPVRILSYVIERTTDEQPRYRFTLEFKGEADGATNIALPNEWGGQTELYKAIKNVRVLTKNAVIADTAEPHIKQVSHRPGEEIAIEYYLEQDFTGPLRNRVRYRPVVEKDYIHWIGYTVLAHPEVNEGDAIRASFEWKGFPKTWTFANTYGPKPAKQKEAFEFSELGRSITVAGDFRVSTVRVKGNPINVAIRGKWEFSDADLAGMVRRVVEIQRDFWDDHSQERYLVTLVPIDEGENPYSFGGTGLRDSFALFATPNATVAGLRGLLAHEYFHNWNPGALGKMPDPEQQMYWLSEGFTDYYTFALLYRGGVMTLGEYVKEVNERVREYYMLPTRTEPNDRIVKDFWNDRNVGRLPYLRGMIFAMNLDAAIRKASDGKHSLDDMVKDMYRASREKKVELTPSAIAGFAAQYVGGDLMPEIERTIIRGELISPDAAALGSGVELQTVNLPVWEPGFDIDHMLKTREIKGVKTGSAAYDAGLRDGQKLVGGVSISFGNTEQALGFTVSGSDGERSVKFLPIAREPLAVPQFSVRK